MRGGLFIYFGMFDGLICGNLARAITDSLGEERLIELRLRVGRQALMLTTSAARIGVKFAGAPYLVTARDIEDILTRASNMSIYSVSEEMLRGYIPSKKVRIGVGGEGVSDGGKLIGIKNVAYMVIRVPHQVKSAADGVVNKVMTNDGKIKSTLIVSPPSAGKTTILRELARMISSKFNTVIIDERYELAAVLDGVPTLDIGDSEVVSGVPKTIAYQNCVRAMNPEVIVTDEIFSKEEVAAICDIVRCGVRVLASVHGEDLEALRASELYSPLLKCFELLAVLKPVGKLVAVTEL